MLLSTFESPWALNGLVKEVCEIDGSIFSAEHPVGNTAAADLIAFVGSCVLLFLPIGARIAFGEMAVERFDSIYPNFASRLAACANDEGLNAHWKSQV